jgi:hypothetical protein
MAVTLEVNARNAAADAVAGLLDGGTIEFQTSGNVEVATVTFGTPAFGSAVGGVATANAITEDSSVTGGTIAKYVAKTSGGDAVLTGTVTTIAVGTGDITLSSVVLVADETLRLDGFTVTAPAS